MATQIGAVTSILPSLLLSGFIFPVENMPWLLRGIASVVPARYMIACMRGIMLQGRGLDLLWPQLLALAALACVILGLCTLKFKRSLD